MNIHAEFTNLRKRLWDHRFEHPERKTDLVRRLVNEQGWSLNDAREAIDEYRKFCFLAVVAPHCVTPSHAVDLVWHTHLLYTRDYWEIFCPNVLGQLLHHGPANGAEDDNHFSNQYGFTLDLYQEHFGELNEKWWPEVRERFPPASKKRWVDLNNTWMIAKPQWFERVAHFFK